MGALRKRVAFDRFLERVFASEESRAGPQAPAGSSGSFVLKGGYALEARMRTASGRVARTTRDLDLSSDAPSEGHLLRALNDASARDLGDYFSFSISPKKRRRRGPPEAEGRGQSALQFSVESFVGDKPFEVFALDVGIEEQLTERPGLAEGASDLEFAGLSRAKLPVYPLDAQFAEKLHAYTTPHATPTRVKDLVDMTIILETLHGDMPEDSEVDASVKRVFDRRGSHPLVGSLHPPPAGWAAEFQGMAEKAGLKTTDHLRAHERLCTFLSRLGSGRA